MREYESVPTNPAAHRTLGEQRNHHLWQDHTTGQTGNHAHDDDDDNDHQNGHDDEDDEDIGIIAANFPHTIIRAKNTIIRAPEFLLQSGVCTMTLPFGQTLGGACSFFIIIDN